MRARMLPFPVESLRAAREAFSHDSGIKQGDTRMKHSKMAMLAKPISVGSMLATCALLTGAEVAAATFEFTGTVETCTPTCKSFAFLGVGSTLEGFIEMDDDGIADGTWDGDDVTDFSFTVGDPSVPPFGPSDPPDPIADNPFTLDATADGGGLVVANGQEICNPRGCWEPPLVIVSSGLTDGVTLTSGLMDLWLTTTVLANNGAIVSINFGAGTFEVTIFEKTVVVATGTLGPTVPDSDDDGLADDADNCTLVANTDQRDVDEDGIGSLCDADLDNTCNVNFGDLGLFKSVFFSDDEEADFDDSGAVNFVDLGLVKEQFFGPPGPSGIDNVCSP